MPSPDLSLGHGRDGSWRRQLQILEKGHVISGRQEGGEWSPLLSDNLSGGLFDEKRLIVVESASLLGPFPENLDAMVEADSSVVILLIYESDPVKIFPPDTFKKCTVLKAAPFPRWPRERMMWTLELAGKMGIKIDRDAVSLIIELTEDPEEIRRQLISLSMLKKGGTVTSDVESMCLTTGPKLLKLRWPMLRRSCQNDQEPKRYFQNGDLIPRLCHTQQMRLAWYASMHPGRERFAQALGAKNYAWTMAGNAARSSWAAAIGRFILGLIKINIDEKSGTGSGWAGLETLVIELSR